jgi:hypothetical protein
MRVHDPMQPGLALRSVQRPGAARGAKPGEPPRKSWPASSSAEIKLGRDLCVRLALGHQLQDQLLPYRRHRCLLGIVRTVAVETLVEQMTALIEWLVEGASEQWLGAWSVRRDSSPRHSA